MKPSLAPRAAALLAAFGPLFCLACSSSSGAEAPMSPSGAGGDAGVRSDGAVTGEDFAPTAADFDCLEGSEWTTVGVSRFKNTLGHTAEMLAVARSADGGVYPVGTMIQLVTTEASVKRGDGYSPPSHDWEFFSLGVTAAGTKILASAGDASVKNFTGSSCLSCHSGAAAKWDFVCGDVDGGNTHGCAALPISGADLALSQGSDPRCVAAAGDGGDGGDGGADE